MEFNHIEEDFLCIKVERCDHWQGKMQHWTALKGGKNSKEPTFVEKVLEIRTESHWPWDGNRHCGKPCARPCGTEASCPGSCAQAAFCRGEPGEAGCLCVSAHSQLNQALRSQRRLNTRCKHVACLINFEFGNTFSLEENNVWELMPKKNWLSGGKCWLASSVETGYANTELKTTLAVRFPAWFQTLNKSCV